MKVTMFKTKKGSVCTCLTTFSNKTGRDEIITFDTAVIMKLVTFSQLAECEELYLSTGFGSVEL